MVCILVACLLSAVIHCLSCHDDICTVLIRYTAGLHAFWLLARLLSADVHWLSGNGDICTILIKHGADIEARTPRGLTPLHFAAIGGYVHENNAVSALLRVSDDKHVVHDIFMCPLFICCWAGLAGKQCCECCADGL